MRATTGTRTSWVSWGGATPIPGWTARPAFSVFVRAATRPRSPLDEVRDSRIVETTVGDLAVLLAAASDDTPVQVYDRRVGERVLTFQFTDGDQALRDNETATTWRLADGVAIHGPLAGDRLTRVVAHPAFWFGWQGFFPRSEVWHAKP